MADLQKTLESITLQLSDMRNALNGIIDETFPQKLAKTWKNFEDTNEEVIKRSRHIIEHLKKNKNGEVDPVMQKDLEVIVKKWTAVNNVYGGLLQVSSQCKDAMSTWDKVEKDLKKL